MFPSKTIKIKITEFKRQWKLIDKYVKWMRGEIKTEYRDKFHAFHNQKNIDNIKYLEYRD